MKRQHGHTARHDAHAHPPSTTITSSTTGIIPPRHPASSHEQSPTSKDEEEDGAQLRAEKDEWHRQLLLGAQLVDDLDVRFGRYMKEGFFPEERYYDLNEFLKEANRASELFQSYYQSYPACIPDIRVVYIRVVYIKSMIHSNLGHHTLALAAYREADELLIAADREGSMSVDRRRWMIIPGCMDDLYLASHQLDSAKQCFLRRLTWTRQSPGDRVEGLHCMGRYHQMRKEWDNMTEYCEQARCCRTSRRVDQDVIQKRSY